VTRKRCYSADLISRITGLARPSVSSSVPYKLYLETKMLEKETKYIPPPVVSHKC